MAASFHLIAERLQTYAADEKSVLVNYDNPSEETGSAGAAIAGSGQVELSNKLLQGLDTNRPLAVAVLVHEAAHETDGRIVDLGYRNTPGFEAMTVKDKAANASHYEEVVWRYMGKSNYQGAFIPKSGVLSGTSQRDVVQKTAKAASDGIENLWNFSSNFPDIVAEFPKLGKKADDAMRRFRTAFGLPTALPTVPNPLKVTPVDLSLAESVAMVLHRSLMKVSRPELITDPRLLERASKYKEPIDFAQWIISTVGGFDSDKEQSAVRHHALVDLYDSVLSKSAY